MMQSYVPIMTSTGNDGSGAGEERKNKDASIKLSKRLLHAKVLQLGRADI